MDSVKKGSLSQSIHESIPKTTDNSSLVNMNGFERRK